MPSLRDALCAHQPSIVGSITSQDALFQSFTTTDCDLIELRLDALGFDKKVLNFAKRHSETLPILITARGPEEGGLHQRTIPERIEAIETLLPFASALDIELRAISELSAMWELAKQNDLIRIASFHNFQELPPDDQIFSTLDAMAKAEADVAKIAFHLETEEDLNRLASLARQWGKLPLSFMGMGELGPASRVLAIASGSVLNYGYLGNEPTAPGQSPAKLLKQVLAHTPVPGGGNELTDPAKVDP